MILNTNFNTQNNSPNGLYDPIYKRINTEPFIKRMFGNKIFTRLKKEIQEAKEFRRGTPEEAFSESLTKTMKNTLVKRFPDFGDIEKPFTERSKEAYRASIGFYYENEADKKLENLESVTSIQRQRQKRDDFFWMLERGIFLNPEFRRFFKSMFTVYGWMWSNIVRDGWIDKKGYPIKEKYYDRGLLAYCASYSKIAKDCFVDKDTVKKYVDRLKGHGMIKVDLIIPEGRKLPQSVYILGKWMMNLDGKPDEKLYLEEVFLSPKKGSIWDL